MLIHMLLYLWIQKYGGDLMCPRTGRPTEDPKILSLRIRLSKKYDEYLTFCSTKLNVPKSEIIRQGIQEVYNKIK